MTVKRSPITGRLITVVLAASGFVGMAVSPAVQLAVLVAVLGGSAIAESRSPAG